MQGWSINLFRIRGIQLALHYSFALLLAYAAFEGFQEAGFLGMAWAVVLMLGIFTCVVLHELGHSFTARYFGVRVRRILLMPIGGMAEFDNIPREPRRELLITIAGPAVNFLIAGILWLFLDPAGAGSSASDLPKTVSELGWILFFANLYLGLFNLIPVFPMDGGRILRALLAIRLPYVRATFWAATIGKVLAAVGVVAALWLHLPLRAALFLFIFVVGELEYRSIRAQERQEAYWNEVRERFKPAPPFPQNPAGEPPLLGPN